MDLKLFFLTTALVILVKGLPPVAPRSPSGQLLPRSQTTYSDRHPARGFDSELIKGILNIISKISPFDDVIDAVTDLLTFGEEMIAFLVGIDTDENDLEGDKCADVTIIFARGTAEVGNVGILAGPPLFEAVAHVLDGKTLGVQGVHYDANVDGFFAGGNKNGSKTM